MDNPTRFVILCEDLQQYVFARTFLVACGICGKRIIPKLGPKGKGAAEAFVRGEFPKEVRSFRVRAASGNIGLVVIIDADMQSVKKHFLELDLALEHAGLVKRQPVEKIGVFIPKRNIETWIYYLMGQPVNELDVYPQLSEQSKCKPYVKDLARKRHDSLSDNAPPSLVTACDELHRVI